jgi:hypothetical protein
MDFFFKHGMGMVRGPGQTLLWWITIVQMCQPVIIMDTVLADSVELTLYIVDQTILCLGPERYELSS